MKALAKSVLVTACLLLVTGFPGVGLPWGDAPTHFSISSDPAVQAKIAPQNFLLFVQASACPDIANTLLFRSTGRTFVHDENFVEALFYVANNPTDKRWKRYWKPQWLATVQGWEAHLTADRVAHTEYVPEEPGIHSMVEFEVDTCVYYEIPVPSALGVGSWRNVNLGRNCCDPWLIYWASYVYTNGTRPVYRWMTEQALDTLKTTIKQEYDLIASRDGHNEAEALLKLLVPGKDWQTYYNNSVAAVAAALP